MSDNVIDHLAARERFGTQTRLAKAAGVKPNTISEKRRSNTLTHQQMRQILRAGPEMGVAVEPRDFFPELTGVAPPDAASTPQPSSDPADRSQLLVHLREKLGGTITVAPGVDLTEPAFDPDDWKIG